MPRYVLLRHECPPDYRDGPHWDLMLEAAGALRTWSLLELPAAWSRQANKPVEVAATELADHRLAYLDYEGQVSGGRGSVSRVAAGEYATRIDEVDHFEAEATSGALLGVWRLAREEGARWRLAIS